MWFEGSVLVKDFPAKLAELMQTTPHGSPEPMWRLVSTNIGSTLNDNGYILHSRGSSGKDNIYVGVSNALASGTASWETGHRFFIAENYTPGTSNGVNGKIENLLHTGHRYHSSDDYLSSTYLTMKIHYGISVTKDRVIITSHNGLAISFASSIRSFTYLGLIKRYSEETDSSASVIATNYSYPTNDYSSIRALRNKQLTAGGSYTPKFKNYLNDGGLNGWSKKFFATHVPLYTATEGYRGELDGVLVARYVNNPAHQGRTIPENGCVTIDGKEYLTVYKTYYHLSKHNNFDDGTEAFIYLIEKK